LGDGEMMLSADKDHLAAKNKAALESGDFKEALADQAGESGFVRNNGPLAERLMRDFVGVFLLSAVNLGNINAVLFGEAGCEDIGSIGLCGSAAFRGEQLADFVEGFGLGHELK
jgi:hypothetical protein